MQTTVRRMTVTTVNDCDVLSRPTLREANILLGTNEPDIYGSCMGDMLGAPSCFPVNADYGLGMIGKVNLGAAGGWTGLVEMSRHSFSVISEITQSLSIRSTYILLVICLSCCLLFALTIERYIYICCPQYEQTFWWT